MLTVRWLCLGQRCMRKTAGSGIKHDKCWKCSSGYVVVSYPQQTNISTDKDRRAGLLAIAEPLVTYIDLTLLSHSCWLDGTVMSVGRSSSSYALFILLYVSNNIRIYWIFTKISSGNLLKICLVRFVDTPFCDVSEYCVIAISLHHASHSCSICSNVWVTEQVR